MTWISYAQNFEDVTLMRALRHIPKGFYVDVGANEPRADSVTRAFYERGWRGINIEPVEDCFKRLCEDRLRDVNLQLAVGDESGRVTFYEIRGTGLSTADVTLADQYRMEGFVVVPHCVPVRTLADICLEHAQTDIHFLKIDVEGAEERVLRGMDFARIRPWIVLVESTTPRSAVPSHGDWEHLLLQQRYRFAWFDGLNRFYVAIEHEDLLPLVAQPPHVFDDFMRETERFLRADVAEYRHQLHRVQELVAMLEHDLVSLRSSRSWKLTAPLRFVSTQWRRWATHSYSAEPLSDASPEPDPAMGIGGPPVSVSSDAVTPQTEVVASSDSRKPAYPPSAESLPAPQPVREKPLTRPLLALVGPLPPRRTGVASSLAAMIPALLAWYEIEVVDESDPLADHPDLGETWRSQVTFRTAAWFLDHAHRYHRICHHLGNSAFHAFQLPLLERHGGVVVLHDVQLSDLLHHLEVHGGQNGIYTSSLYDEQGWAPLLQRIEDGDGPTVRKWLASGRVLAKADALIVHSQHAAQRLQRAGLGKHVSISSLPVAVEPGAPTAEARTDARKRLGIPEGSFVVATFGGIDPSKLNHRLVSAWALTNLSKFASAKLVCVGDGQDVPYLDQLGGAGAHVTGYADAATYQDWLNSADLAVQLRSDSRGETSGAVLDVLAAGIPTIINDHGSAAELPMNVALHLPEAFDDLALAQAMDTLWRHPRRRQQLSAAAVLHVRQHSLPLLVGRHHAQVLESRGLKPGATNAVRRPTRSTARTLWVDVTAIAIHDLGSGIQRVTRSILRELLQRSVPGWRVEPVYLSQGRYRFARRFTARWLRLPELWLDALPGDDLMEPQPGDVFFGLDLVTDGVAQHGPIFMDWRHLGIRICFFVHDLLPLQHPGWFPQEATDHFARWWRVVSQAADLLITNSNATASDVRLWYESSGSVPQRPAPPVVRPVALGADIDASVPSRGASPEQLEVLDRIQSSAAPVVLVVGTIEPRKGVDAVLDAFDTLWAEGWPGCLLLTGRAGWMVEALIQRIESHSLRGRKLWWVPDASDEWLQMAYRRSDVLLMASRGEGYGLPIVEARHAGLAVLARDLSVFREVAASNACFWGPEDSQLVDALRALPLTPQRAFEEEASAPPPRLTRWSETADQVLTALLGAASCAESQDVQFDC